MKFLICSDSHYTDRTPVRRKDNILETQLNKSEQIYKIFMKYQCDYLLHAGDVFNSADVSNYVIAQIIKYFYKYPEKNVISIYGQHDISGHSEYTLKRSPLSVLQSAGCLYLLDSINNKIQLSDSICVYGAPFGCAIPKVDNERIINILLIHAPIGNNKFYDGVIYPKEIVGNLRNYSVVICGDFHYRFIEKQDGVLFINPGCLVRKTIDKKDLEHRPGVVLLDTDKLSTEVIELNFKPYKDIFDFSNIDKVKLDESSLNSLIDKLSRSESFTVDWKKILLQVYTEDNTSVGIKNLLDKEIQLVTKG